MPLEFRDFAPGDLGTLVRVLGSRALILIRIDKCGKSLPGPAFWASLRAVAASCRLRELVLNEIQVPISGRDIESLGHIKTLETLCLTCSVPEALPLAGGRRLRARAGRCRSGLLRFPKSLLGLTRLRKLALDRHENIASVPAGISSLRNLEVLCVSGSSRLTSLPAELATLSRLTLPFVAGNRGLGEAPEESAFPAELQKMGYLRSLNLSYCNLRAAPSFVGHLKSLEDLYLHNNSSMGSALGSLASFGELPMLTLLSLGSCGLSSLPPAVLSSMPRLRSLLLANNSLTTQLEDLGRRLPELEGIDLGENAFAAVPRALGGATKLETILLDKNPQLQVEEPLDFLLNLLLLKELWLTKPQGSTWSLRSAEIVAEFCAKLKRSEPEAVVEVVEFPRVISA